jgi:hypothetical protein
LTIHPYLLVINWPYIIILEGCQIPQHFSITSPNEVWFPKFLRINCHISYKGCSRPLVPEIIITLEDITRENGPLVNPPISLSWGRQNRGGMGRSVRGQTPLNLEEGIAGVSTGMAFARRQTASLYTSAPTMGRKILR